MSAGRLASKLLVEPREIVNAQPVRQKAGSGDFGRPPAGGVGWEPVAGRDPFSVFPQQEDAAEQTRAGKDTSQKTWRLWALPLSDGSSPATQKDHLDVAGIGVVNITGDIKYQTERLVRIDAEKVGQ